LALKSLRKGWESETEQWQILIEFRLPKLTPETRTHRARGGFDGLAAAKACRKAPVQIIRIDRTY
jgi:hypothetical protein